MNEARDRLVRRITRDVKLIGVDVHSSLCGRDERGCVCGYDDAQERAGSDYLLRTFYEKADADFDRVFHGDDAA